MLIYVIATYVLMSKESKKICILYIFIVFPLTFSLNPKRFWSFTKSKRKCSSIPKQMNFNGNLYSTVKLIATAFNDYFQSVLVANEPSQSCYLCYPNNNNVSSALFTVLKIVTYLLEWDKRYFTVYTSLRFCSLLLVVWP